MIAPRFALIAIAALAVYVARKRRDALPSALVLVTLAAIDCARGMGLPARVDAALWMMWPCPYAALAWYAWRGRWWSAALPFAAYTAAVLLVPVSWSQHPEAWALALRVPHGVAPLVAALAWALKDEGPGNLAGSPSPALHLCNGPSTTTAPSRAIAAVLAFSGLLDVTIGALAPRAGWVRAAPLAWATWATIGAILLTCARTGKR